MEAPWKMRNALRLTADYEVIAWNQRNLYRKGDIVYFVSKSQRHDEETPMVHVCFWSRHRTHSSDIPNEFHIPENYLELAPEVADREVINYGFNFNPRCAPADTNNGAVK